MRRLLKVMKFGGTSVGNATCIARVVDIIRAASRECNVAVVVSAMAGVTNRLIDAANQSTAGNEIAAAEIFAQLGKRHDEAVTALIHSAPARRRLQNKLPDLLAEGQHLCQEAILRHELSPRALDAISGLGERLSAPLIAAALSEIGVASEAINATELIVTDSYHGGAEPSIGLTRARCQARVTPLLHNGIVPVMTGFIGATEEGVLTTLGRGGSDYSATILGAALDADEILIWSDVPGLLTADPKLVAEASTIPEISYREAAEMACFGAKVLHPKTLCPVVQDGIPIWIKNTFTPDESGTKITPEGPLNGRGVKAVTATRDAALITISGPVTQCVPDALARAVTTSAAVRSNVLLILQSASHSDIRLVVESSRAKRTVEALRHEFSSERTPENGKQTVFDTPVSVITLVGHNMRTESGTVARAVSALGQKSVNIIATVHGPSDCSVSFVIPRPDVQIAVATLHRELELGSLPSSGRLVKAMACRSAMSNYEPEPASAD
jgi:aspartokinase/homoserine dehydrogenase 1